MKNIQVIDGAENCVYDVFSATDAEFDLIFPAGQDVAFIDEVYALGESEKLDQAFNFIWERRLAKSQIQGIHGTLFYELEHKKAYYPNRRDDDAVVAFIDEVYALGESDKLDQAFNLIWDRRRAKSQIQGIHGTLFYELEHKKAYYPNRRDDDAVNPDGSRLR